MTELNNKKSDVIQALSREFGRRFLHVDSSSAAEAVKRFRTATPDNLGGFWQATRLLGEFSMEAALELAQAKHNDEAGVDAILVGVPRGAYPSVVGALSVQRMPYIITNDGETRNPNLPLIPRIINVRAGNVFLADPAIDTGETIRRTINGLTESGIHAERITLLAVIAYPATVAELLEESSNLSIITADIESRRISALDGSAGCWLADFGDAGGLAVDSLKQNPAFAEVNLDFGLHNF